MSHHLRKGKGVCPLARTLTFKSGYFRRRAVVNPVSLQKAILVHVRQRLAPKQVQGGFLSHTSLLGHFLSLARDLKQL